VIEAKKKTTRKSTKKKSSKKKSSKKKVAKTKSTVTTVDDIGRPVAEVITEYGANAKGEIRERVGISDERKLVEEELTSLIRMLVAHWVTDHPTLTPNEYLIKVKLYSPDFINKIFLKYPKHKWVEAQAQFADRVIAGLTNRGIERVAVEYSKDLEASQTGKRDIAERLQYGELVQVRDNEGKVTREFRRPLNPNELAQCARAFETFQKIADRSLGITDNNRESTLENIKAREREAVQKSDSEVKEIKKLTMDETKLLIEAYRNAKIKKDSTNGENQE